MKTVLLFCILFVIGCSEKPAFKIKIRIFREDGPPFVAGDVVHINRTRDWIVESVVGDKVNVVREPVERSFWGRTTVLPTERETYPASILYRTVSWWDDEPEPAKREIKCVPVTER